PNQTVAVNDGRSIKINNLWLVGYGEWTGMASATLIGVSRTAKAVVDEIAVYLAID
ncbi:pyridine nucleotide-disulfide oxidoreductase, partial [Acinetobacter baumannii]|nr:pyridine nucleotide-disulfide oxidoreductase [Acinetobacter baumannii]